MNKKLVNLGHRERAHMDANRRRTCVLKEKFFRKQMFWKIQDRKLTAAMVSRRSFNGLKVGERKKRFFLHLVFFSMPRKEIKKSINQPWVLSLKCILMSNQSLGLCVRCRCSANERWRKGCQWGLHPVPPRTVFRIRKRTNPHLFDFVNRQKQNVQELQLLFSLNRLICF